MKKLSPFILLILPFMVYAQQPPGTEIYLLDLSVKKSGVTVSNPQNITNKPGYDNQPFFHPDKPLLYYASANAEAKTDLVEYNIKTKAARNLTNTSEREYSPTVTPDKKFLSCIIQRDDGVQDLGKYPIDGGQAEVLINTLKVGYHAWADDGHAIVFALGEPNTLRLYSLQEKKDLWLADSVGRSIHVVPGSKNISFVDKSKTGQWTIKIIESIDKVSKVVETLPGREDLAWMPDGKIIMSDGKKLFYFQPGKTSTWAEIQMPTVMPTGTITRLAVNQKGNALAIVVAE
ncbi:MAG TPA: hypothetical protein VFU05_10935 [Cyclobacteriaceae bacterium]|nr:hypothetical protein [Cyclobacteriaceae bacterium]